MIHSIGYDENGPKLAGEDRTQYKNVETLYNTKKHFYMNGYTTDSKITVEEYNMYGTSGKHDYLYRKRIFTWTKTVTHIKGDFDRLVMGPSSTYFNTGEYQGYWYEKY